MHCVINCLLGHYESTRRMFVPIATATHTMPSNQECQRFPSSVMLGVRNVPLLLAIAMKFTFHYNPLVLLLLGGFVRIIFDEWLTVN